MKTTWLLFIVLINVGKCRSQCVSSNCFISENQFWNNFWLNITAFCTTTQYVSVISNDESNKYSVRDFEIELIKYLNKETTLPLMTFNSKSMIRKACQEDRECDHKNEIIYKYSAYRQIFFIVQGALDDLRSTWNDPKWIIYDNSKRSYFIILIMTQNLENVACNSDTFLTFLKIKAGEYFNEIWTIYQLVEVTIVFPNLCSEEYVLKYDLTKAFDSKVYADGVSILSKGDAFLHEFKDFNQFPIIINIFERFPTLVKSMPVSSREAYEKDVKSLEGIGGLDGYALANMVNRLNFKPVLLESADKAEYGYRRPNGSFSGSIGDIIARKMDISMNARFIKLYGTEAVEFTGPVFYDQFCILAPKSLTIPPWMSIFLVFSKVVWMMIGITVLMAGFVWWFMKTKFPHEDTPKSTVPSYFLFLDICLLMTSAPLAILPVINRERFLISVCLIFNLIFAGLFQGYLSTAYSTTIYYPDISTLEELDKSGIKIATKNVDIFGSNVSHVGQSLTKKIIVDEKNSIHIASTKRTLAVVERKTDAGLLINRNFTTKDGQPTLHAVEECPRSYHLAYIVYKGYPFLEQIKRFFQLAVEGGLNEKWYQDTEFSILLKNRQMQEASVVTRKLKLVDVQTSFLFLLHGLLASVLIFMGELGLSYRKRKCKKKTSKEYPGVPRIHNALF